MAAIESAHLADLHTLAASLGVERYRLLGREELVAAILERDPDASPPEREVRREREKPEQRNGGDGGGGGGRQQRGSRGGRGRERARRDEPEAEPTPVSGAIDITSRGHGFIRLDGDEDDVYVSASQIRRCELRSGDEVAGPARPPRRDERYRALVHVDSINGAAPGEPGGRLTEAAPAPPSRRIAPVALGDAPAEDAVLLGAIELLWPLAFGQRVRIDAAPGSGRTTLLRAFARALAPRDDLELAVLLIDERPEDVPAWEEAAGDADVSVATGDMRAREQMRVVEGALARVTRRVESGADVVLLIDSLSRAGVAADDPSAVKPIFGAGRETAEDDLGSLTVVATTLRGPDGPDATGQALETTESTLIVLQPELATSGIYPAIDVNSSRISGEDSIRDEAELAEARALRAELAALQPAEAASRLRERVTGATAPTTF